MNRILKGWSVVRILLLTMGIFILIEGFRAGDPTYMAFGGFIIMMGILNIGFLGSSTCCNLPPKPENDKMKKDEKDFLQ